MRYIGNKLKLLKEIENLLIEKDLFQKNYTFFDAFSGTASVGNYFKNRFKIIANDSLYFSYVITRAKLNPINKQFVNLKEDPFIFFNRDDIGLEGFIYKNYSPGGSERMYFSEDNAKRIDYIRKTIEKWYKSSKINEDEYFYLIACLLESVSKVANVAGVYGSYLKHWDSRALKIMKFIDIEGIENNNIFRNEVYNELIEELICDIKGDILYLDPPYTNNQYSTQYHLLETIALYDNPEIYGKTGHREVVSKNSGFSKNGLVHIEFEKLIKKAKFRHIILSYSSGGLMSKDYIESILKKYAIDGTYTVKEIKYKQYLNCKTTNTNNHYEYLFYIEKKSPSEVLYKSPLNYIGGKYHMIDFILKNIPNKFTKFIDLFGGGFNVGININADQVFYNDINFKVKELLEMFKNEDLYMLYKYLFKMIKKFKLEKNGKDSYIKLRDFYNAKPLDKRNPKILYLLILYGFNQQIRFNSNLEYNNPVGQSGMNDKILANLISFVNHLKSQNVIFYSKNYSEMFKYMDKETFVYVDPPYLITCASYNDGKRGFNGWDIEEEKKLLSFLSKLNNNNIKFMLSNILKKDGKENSILIEWIEKNGFNIIEYKGKVRKGRNEVLITNYIK